MLILSSKHNILECICLYMASMHFLIFTLPTSFVTIAPCRSCSSLRWQGLHGPLLKKGKPTSLGFLTPKKSSRPQLIQWTYTWSTSANSRHSVRQILQGMDDIPSRSDYFSSHIWFACRKPTGFLLPLFSLFVMPPTSWLHKGLS